MTNSAPPGEHTDRGDRRGEPDRERHRRSQAEQEGRVVEHRPQRERHDRRVGDDDRRGRDPRQDPAQPQGGKVPRGRHAVGVVRNRCSPHATRSGSLRRTKGVAPSATRAALWVRSLPDLTPGPGRTARLLGRPPPCIPRVRRRPAPAPATGRGTPCSTLRRRSAAGAPARSGASGSVNMSRCRTIRAVASSSLSGMTRRYA